SDGSDGNGFGLQCPPRNVHVRIGPRDPSGSRSDEKNGDGEAERGKSKEETKEKSILKDHEKEGFFGCRPKEPRNSARATNASVSPERPQQRSGSPAKSAESASNDLRPAQRATGDEVLDVHPDEELITWSINNLERSDTPIRES